MFSDFHAGEGLNPKLIRGIEALTAEAGPDFVMVGGDQCVRVPTVGEVAEHMAAIMEPVIKRNIPWAAVFGNHDRENGRGLSLADHMAAYREVPGCLAEAGPEEIHGVGNYCLSVLSSKSDEPSFNIWGMDSGREMRDWIDMFGLDRDDAVFVLPDHFCEGMNGATPLFDQVQWYYNKSAGFEKAYGRPVPGVMFMHIALPEYVHICHNPEECGAEGSKRVAVDGSEISSGLFLAALERGDIRGFFFGHDHHCDIAGKYCGVTMACDACVGYDMTGHDDLRGGRIIDLYEDEGKIFTRTLKLIDLLGPDAIRDPDYFEGGCRYFIRKLD